MQNRIKIAINESLKNHSQGSSARDVTAFIPRLWMIMIPFAVPFLITTGNYFEALERTGSAGTLLADMLMPITNIAYVVLIFILKSRKI